MNFLEESIRILGADAVAEIRTQVRADLAANPYTDAELDHFAPLLNRLREAGESARRHGAEHDAA